MSLDLGASSALRRGTTAAALLLLATLASCQDGPAECEPPLTHVKTEAALAELPDLWAQPGAETLRLVVTTGPYRVSEAAIETLRGALAEQAGLALEVIDGIDTHLPATDVANWPFAVERGRAQLPDGDAPAMVVVMVQDTTAANSTFGFASFDWSDRRTAVLVLHRAALRGFAIAPVSMETLEASTMLHEVGHWLGVPARTHHISAVDSLHCTNARCVMFAGGRINSCAVSANLAGGIPLRFGPDCAEELAELARRRAAR